MGARISVKRRHRSAALTGDQVRFLEPLDIRDALCRLRTHRAIIALEYDSRSDRRRCGRRRSPHSRQRNSSRNRFAETRDDPQLVASLRARIAIDTTGHTNLAVAFHGLVFPDMLSEFSLAKHLPECSPGVHGNHVALLPDSLHVGFVPGSGCPGRFRGRVA